MGLASLQDCTSPACELGEVASTPPMQESAASESSPRNAHIVQGFSPAPLLQSLLANGEQDRTAALALGTHGRHAPLAIVAGASPTRNSLDDLDLCISTGVLDNMRDEDDALVAGVRALQAGVMRLYGVVVILGRWVRGCARLLCGHRAVSYTHLTLPTKRIV